MNGDDRYVRGLQTRREVLGSEHVDRALTNATEFSQPLQDMVTECCWGTVWDRPGLDRRTRSLLTIAILASGSHHEELALHAMGAIRNGCTEAEISETLLHVGTYCGIPAAVSAFRTAERALASRHLAISAPNEPATQTQSGR